MSDTLKQMDKIEKMHRARLLAAVLQAKEILGDKDFSSTTEEAIQPILNTFCKNFAQLIVEEDAPSSMSAVLTVMDIYIQTLKAQAKIHNELKNYDEGSKNE